MIDRNRAWRRRKAHFLVRKAEEIKQLFVRQFHDSSAKPVAALKQHRHGKLTHAQDLRLAYNLGHQSRDGWELA